MDVKQLAEKHGFAVASTLESLLNADSHEQIRLVSFNYNKLSNNDKKILDQAGFKLRLRQQLTSKFLAQFSGMDFTIVQPDLDTFVFIEDEHKLAGSPEWKRAIMKLYNSSDVFQDLVEKAAI